MTACAVIGRNSSGGEGSSSINNCESKECCEGDDSNELGICEPLGFESGGVEEIEDEESKLVEKSRAEEFDYNTVEACAAQNEVIDYFAPLGEVDSKGPTWYIQNHEEKDGCFEEDSDSLLSIPPLQTVKPLCQERPLFMAHEVKDLGAEACGKETQEMPASIEILRKVNSEQRQQCGAVLALCRELEEGRCLAQACASLFCGEGNSVQDSPRPLSAGSSHLGPYQQWLAREMAWSVKLPASIGPSLSGVQCLVQIMLKRHYQRLHWTQII